MHWKNRASAVSRTNKRKDLAGRRKVRDTTQKRCTRVWRRRCVATRHRYTSPSVDDSNDDDGNDDGDDDDGNGVDDGDDDNDDVFIHLSVPRLYIQPTRAQKTIISK